MPARRVLWSLPQLSEAEQALFERLARQQLRLEQERVAHDFAAARIRAAVGR